MTTGVNDDKELLTRLQALGVDVAAIDAQLLAQVRSSFSLKIVVRLPDQKPITFTPKKGSNVATVDASSQIMDTTRIVLLAAALVLLLLAVIVWIRGGRPRRRRTTAKASAPRPVAPAPLLGGRGAQAPRRRGPHVPHPHRAALRMRRTRISRVRHHRHGARSRRTTSRAASDHRRDSRPTRRFVAGLRQV